MGLLWSSSTLFTSLFLVTSFALLVLFLNLGLVFTALLLAFTSLVVLSRLLLSIVLLSLSLILLWLLLIPVVATFVGLIIKIATTVASSTATPLLVDVATSV